MLLLLGSREMLVDAIVFFHLLCVALGLGVAVRLDFMFFQSRFKKPEQSLLDDAAQSHVIIIAALIGLWCTGLCLIKLRTDFDPAAFTPKLWIKLIVVTMLTLNGLIIGRFALPVMARFRDRPLLAIPLQFKLPMAISAATSAFCWFTALALGAMATLKTQSWSMLGWAFAIEYVIVLLLAASIAVWMRAPSLDAFDATPEKARAPEPKPMSQTATVLHISQS